MKLGEKLQQLRKQSGLSQEQLASQITVSRQAVSKWELDETMPDTENVIQLARLFGVSCDYLLRDEVSERGAPLPAPEVPQPGEAHLTERGWVQNAFALSLGVCALGLVGAFMFYRFQGHTVRPLAIGFMVQLLGVALFELSAARMERGRSLARLNFYAIACWLVLPVPVLMALNWEFGLVGYWNVTPLQGMICYFAVYLLSSAAVTAVLSVLRRRIARNN